MAVIYLFVTIIHIKNVTNCNKVMSDICERNVVKYEFMTHYL